MKLTVIEKALKMYETSGAWTNEDELVAIQNCYIEIAEMKQSAPDHDYYQDVTIIPTTLMMDYGNRMWYDVYGREARQVGHNNMTSDRFISAMRMCAHETEVSRLILEDTYQLLHDLWYDNEQLGYHRSDGTFNDDIQYGSFL